MKVFRTGPEDVMYRVGMIDLSDVVLQLAGGELDRLKQAVVGTYYSAGEFAQLPRSWMKRYAMWSCPEPYTPMRRIFAWFKFYASQPHPDGSPSCLVAAWRGIAKVELSYAMYPSDFPGPPPYVWRGKVNKIGLRVPRALRGSSHQEASHLEQRQSIDPRAKKSSIRMHNSMLRAFVHTYSMKRAVEAGLISRHWAL